MKRYGYILFVVLLAAAGCRSESDYVSTANQGKDKPTVKTALMNKQLHEFTVTVLPSSDAAYFGYVIYEGSGNEAPSAYQIVNGDLAAAGLESAVCNISDGASVTVKTQCTYSETYEVFAAGITEEGVLSNVDTLLVSIPGASPGLEVKTGLYKVNAPKYKDVENPEAGEPFELRIMKWEENPAMYIIIANWFNIADKGYALGPYLLGSVDVEKQQLVFDGRIVNSSMELVDDVKAFGTGFMDYGTDQILVFWSGSDGYSDVTMDLSDGGEVLSISNVRYSIHQSISSGGAFVSYYDSLPDGTPLTYSGE